MNRRPTDNGKFLFLHSENKKKKNGRMALRRRDASSKYDKGMDILIPS